MKVVFLVQCHKLTTPLIYNILKFSKIRDVRVFIHVDKKSDITPFLTLRGDNVFLIKKRIDVHWGGQAQINVTLNLFEEIRHLDFDYASFISGDDLFHHPFSDFNDFLKKNYGQEFIGVVNTRETEFQSRFKIKYPNLFLQRNLSPYFRFMKKIYMTSSKLGLFHNKNKCPFKHFYKGSNWFTLSKAAITYIQDEISKNIGIIKYFENSFCCDEIIFQSILMNSHFKDSIYKLLNDNYDDNKMSLRYIDWSSGPEYPKILYKKDLSIELPRDIFFIRKVDSQIPLDFIQNKFGK
ncbi:beta-1,6-N-acetylglucosaminyltransferase [Pseudocolwellia agarivorans]|uniref:beta-1,6-N-acetylglucosaminyltransferase n=1 Tax=Pseudocolwellia agarivorans TaxID=1911682 RepID=UPI003F883544